MKKILCTALFVSASILPFGLTFAQNADLDKANELYNAGDYAASESYFVRGAENGPAQSQMFVAQQYVYGMFGDIDKAKAAYWYEKAAEQGDTLGMKSLAVMLAKGDGVAMDKPGALQWLQRAKAGGDTSVDEMIAELQQQIPTATPTAPTQQVAQRTNGYEDFENGDYAAAFPKLIGLAEGGEPNVQRMVGWLYLYGEGTTPDPDKGVEYLEAAADQMDIEAMTDLGLIYDYGEGVAEDKIQARKWYTQAALMGSEDAQLWLDANPAQSTYVPPAPAQAAPVQAKPKTLKDMAGPLRTVYPFSEAGADEIVNECMSMSDAMTELGDRANQAHKVAAALGCAVNLSEFIRMEDKNESYFKSTGSDGSLEKFAMILDMTELYGEATQTYIRALNHGNDGKAMVTNVSCGLANQWAIYSEMASNISTLGDGSGKDYHSGPQKFAEEWCAAANGPKLDDKGSLYTFAVRTHELNPGVFDPGVAKILANLAAAGHAPSKVYLDNN